MCIRDSTGTMRAFQFTPEMPAPLSVTAPMVPAQCEPCQLCLLYTSDAADERSSVDLGGRRIIKKKKKIIDRSESQCKMTTAHKYIKTEDQYQQEQ